MNAIRHTLQRELFQQEDERLLGVLHVTKPGKKKQNAFLCITISAEPPVTVRLYQVKKSERGPVFYKKKRTWLLRDLKVVDGKNPRKQIPDFELTLDKVYQWEATNVTEKEPFIRQLWKLSEKYIPVQKPDFVNVSLPVDELEAVLLPSIASGGEGGTGHGDHMHRTESEDYQPISTREEADFRRLLDKCQMTLSDAHKFALHLTNTLSMLDGANLDAILGSEVDLLDLMDCLDDAFSQSEAIEAKLDSYDQVLANVRETVEMMEEKDSLHYSYINNRQKLSKQLTQFVAAMNISPEQKKILEQANLSDLSNITRCTQAAITVLRASRSPDIGTGVDKMKAFEEQQKVCSKLIDGFSEKLVAQLSALFNRFSESGELHEASGGGRLANRGNVHQALMPYSELISWLKTARYEAYKVVLERYVKAFSGFYHAEIDAFFAQIMREVIPASFDRKPSLKRAPPVELFNRSAGSVDLGTGLDIESVDHDRFHQTLTKLLSQLEPMLSAEQKFCIRFFHLSHASGGDIPTANKSADANVSPSKKLEKQFNEEVKLIMTRMFSHLDTDLENFVNHCDRTNPVFLMILLGHLWRHVMTYEDTAAYVSVLLGRVVVIAKRKFDAYMKSQLQNLQEVRLPKRTKIGVCPFVQHFERLITESEMAFKESARRLDVERWYGQILSGVFEAIERLSQDPNSKAPPPVVTMENYHRIFSILSQLKVSCLEHYKKEAKQRYQDNLQIYVEQYMGRPLDRLSTFFDNMDRCIEQGLRPEEVGYQMKFSRQELEKLLKEYPAREVRKGLEHLYSKVEKHLSEQENLFQVVWHLMQDQFINQYKHYEGLIGRCYPNASLRLEFTIEDILQFFSEIARKQ